LARILVNCHGGRVGLNPPDFQVPMGKSVHFYCMDETTLDDAIAWQVLSHRMDFRQGDPAGIQTVAGGQQCKDYYGVPYNKLQVVNGVQLEDLARGKRGFTPILESGKDFSWGLPNANTIHLIRANLPAIRGGAAYDRDVIQLSDIVNCPGVTDIDWISCRELWG
jgi:hypothetical protein